MKSIKRLFCLIIALSSLVACSTVKKATEIFLPETKITPSQNLEGQWQSAQSHLQEATAAYETGNLNEAFTTLSNLLGTELPIGLERVIHFNMGVILEKQHRYELAETQYQMALEGATHQPFKKELLARILKCQEKSGHWLDGIGTLKLLEPLLEQTQEKQITLIRKTYLLLMLEQVGDAKNTYQKIDSVFWSQIKSDDLVVRYYQAEYRALNVLFELKVYLEIMLALPEPVLKTRFERKIEQVIHLENLILKVFETKQPYWSLKVLSLLGMIYRDLFFQLSNLPADQNLDREEKQVFRYELQKQLIPVLRKSAYVFQKQVDRLKKLNQDASIVQKSEQRLTEIRQMIEHLQNRRLVIQISSELNNQEMMKLETVDE